jgi:hypothetical protein
MSFGLTNAPLVFMDMMNRVFHDYLDQFHRCLYRRHTNLLKDIRGAQGALTQGIGEA